MQENSEKIQNGNGKSFLNILDELKTSILERTDRPKYPTGIETLDEMVWGIHKKELMVIAARPSHGKTSIALQIAWNCSKIQNTSVIFLSLEMSAMSLAEKIMSQEFKIHNQDLRRGAEKERSIENIEKLKARWLEHLFEVFDNKGKRLEEVEETIKQFSPDIVVIDHIQRISSKGHASKQDAIAYYIQGLKEFAIKYNLAVIACSQINRGGSKMEFAMDFMKGSGEIEEAADTILQCNWLVRDDSKELPNDYQIKTIKQRHGAMECKVIHFAPQFSSFRDKTEKELYESRTHQGNHQESDWRVV